MYRTPNPQCLRAHLRRGGIIAYPTEYCYGLGCDPRHTRALARLLRLKKRPQHKGFIVIGQNLAQLQTLLQPLSPDSRAQLNALWPAAKTVILPAHDNVLPTLRGRRRAQLAVRVPDHNLARRLCAMAKMPLVSTSCNRAGGVPCRDERVAKRLFGRDVWVLGGRVGGRKQPSEIVDWCTNIRLR